MLTSWREFKIGYQRPATEVRRLSRAGGSDGFERLRTVEHFMWSLAIGALVLGLLVRDVDSVRTVFAAAFKFRPARRTGFVYRRWAPVRYRRVGHGRSVCLGF